MSVGVVTGLSYQVGFLTNQKNEAPQKNKSNIFNADFGSTVSQKFQSLSNETKLEYIDAVNNEFSSNQSFKSLESNKFDKSATIFSLSARKANVNYNISSLQAQKSTVSSSRSSSFFQKSITGVDVNFISSQISQFRDKLNVLLASISTNSNTSIAIDTNQTIQGNNSTGAVIAEGQNAGSTEIKESIKEVGENIKSEIKQSDVEKLIKELKSKISKLELELSSANNQQSDLNFEITDYMSDSLQLEESIDSEICENKKIEANLYSNETEKASIDSELNVKPEELENKEALVQEIENRRNKIDKISISDFKREEEAFSLINSFRK